MKINFKSLFFCLIASFFMVSCDRNKKAKESKIQIENKEMKNRQKEEEIKYFHTVGYYDLNLNSIDIENLSEDYYSGEELGEPYQHLEWEDIYSYVNIRPIEKDVSRGVFYIINSKWELVKDIRSLVNISDFIKTNNEIYYKLKVDLDNYMEIDEFYNIEGGLTRSRKYYCKNLHPQIVKSQPSVYDKVFVRLHDKSNKIISENKMRNEVFSGVAYYRGAENNLIGVLELPPKSEREGLKYRVVRLKPNGQPSLYFSPEFKAPTQNYLWEEKLPPYSEYKNWNYIEEIGCYVYRISPPINHNKYR